VRYLAAAAALVAVVAIAVAGAAIVVASRAMDRAAALEAQLADKERELTGVRDSLANHRSTYDAQFDQTVELFDSMLGNDQKIVRILASTRERVDDLESD